MRAAVFASLCTVLVAGAHADLIALTNGSDRCVVDTQGGRVVSCEVGGQELLWMPDGGLGDDPVWQHGGIPVAWPWFGRIGKGDENIHGYAWKMPFAVQSRGLTNVVLSLRTEVALLEYTIVLGNALSLQLRTVNCSKFDLPLGVAYHPYFRVGERDRVEVEGLSEMPLHCTNAVDRSVRFGDVVPCCEYIVRDRTLGRSLHIVAENSTGVNLWNPGLEKRCPGVITGEEWRRFVAVEPFAMGQNRFMALSSGNEFVLKMTLRVDAQPKPDCKLPGEDGTTAALPPDPFPDRISAYVWRNWGLVSPERLAEVVGATVEDIVAVAGQLGLVANPSVLPEWKRKGYITVLRRNWHLLPYQQLLLLLDMTRAELSFSLMEDDFLWVKLGSLKPKCKHLRWRAEMREENRRARERLAAILREEGLDPNAEEEPRFKFVKDISAVNNMDERTNRKTENSDPPFDFRLIFSYFADYGDPLGDPEVGSFPEGLLQKLSAQGVNAVWLHTVLRTLVKDPKYPEWGDGCERRLANLQKLVDRCRVYGMRVFLYMNEPRAMDPSFFNVLGRENLAGATHEGLQTLCTLNPETQRWLSDSLEKVFSTVSGLGGIFTITASENLTNCATRPGVKDSCSVCRTHSRAEIIAAANNAMIRGMRRGDPNAEALLYNWAWPVEEMEEIVSRLPTDKVRIMAVSERGIEICRGGVTASERDYSISIVGPGEQARRAWAIAKRHGLGVVAKVQAANSWELSTFPYLPTMDLVAQHASNLANEGVKGVMLSWSLGCCPSPNLGVYQEFRRGEVDKEGVLDRMARRLYGEKAAQARAAWSAFSEGFVHYPFTYKVIYNGPHHWGPANPLYLRKTGYAATMVGIPYDDFDGWRDVYPRETYIELMDKVSCGFEKGCRLMEGVADRRELDMFRAEQMHFASSRDQARFVAARDRGDTAEMMRLAKIELERAKAYWRIVRADSRIGYESSNHYFYIPRDILEKVLSCHTIVQLQSNWMQKE